MPDHGRRHGVSSQAAHGGMDFAVGHGPHVLPEDRLQRRGERVRGTLPVLAALELALDDSISLGYRRGALDRQPEQAHRCLAGLLAALPAGLQGQHPCPQFPGQRHKPDFLDGSGRQEGFQDFRQGRAVHAAKVAGTDIAASQEPQVGEGRQELGEGFSVKRPLPSIQPLQGLGDAPQTHQGRNVLEHRADQTVQALQCPARLPVQKLGEGLPLDLPNSLAREPKFLRQLLEFAGPGSPPQPLQHDVPLPLVAGDRLYQRAEKPVRRADVDFHRGQTAQGARQESIDDRADLGERPAPETVRFDQLRSGSQQQLAEGSNLLAGQDPLDAQAHPQALDRHVRLVGRREIVGADCGDRPVGEERQSRPGTRRRGLPHEGLSSAVIGKVDGRCTRIAGDFLESETGAPADLGLDVQEVLASDLPAIGQMAQDAFQVQLHELPHGCHFELTKRPHAPRR